MFGNFASLFLGQLFGPSLSALETAATTKADGRRVFSLFLWRRLPILNFTRCHIDDELGELGLVAGAFFAWCFLCHAFEYGTGDSVRLACINRIKFQKYPLPIRAMVLDVILRLG